MVKAENESNDNDTKEESTPPEESIKNSEESKEPEFVLVKDVITGEMMELPTQLSDNTLGLTTLTHAFPGAHGLKYKTENGVTRALLIDPSGTKFFPPSTGWAGKTLTVIYNNAAGGNSNASGSLRAEPKWRSTSDQNAKRKKMMDDGNSTDSDHSTSGGHHQVTAKQKRTDGPKKEVSIEEEEEARPTDLIVLGLPYKMTSDDLKKYFSTFGNLAMCEIKKDPKGGSRGFGFIQFESFEAQLKVLARPTHTIGGRRCEVKVPLSKKSTADGSEFTGIEAAKLFVGRLQEKMTDSILREFFTEEGKKIDPKAEILDVFIPKPFRSFAFITFNNMKVVKELIKKVDFIIDGSSVSVSSAAPKGEHPSDIRSERHMSVSSPLTDFTRFRDWGRPGIPQVPTERYNEVAFLRPSEQRKRTFVETGYSMPMEPPFHTLPMTAGPSQQQQNLASGFETLNINHPDMLSAYSYVHNGIPRSPMISSGRQHQPPIMPRRYDYGPPGSGRNSGRSMPSPYSRDDFGYGV